MTERENHLDSKGRAHQKRKGDSKHSNDRLAGTRFMKPLNKATRREVETHEPTMRRASTGICDSTRRNSACDGTGMCDECQELKGAMNAQ